jgi:hypothetical protein
MASCLRKLWIMAWAAALVNGDESAASNEMLQANARLRQAEVTVFMCASDPTMDCILHEGNSWRMDQI